MSTTYDPTDPVYFDDSDMRHELNRVFDLCHGCRMCFYMCTSFPTLFKFVDDKPDQQAHLMSTAEQDQVVEECFHCKMCEVKCPYTPAQNHEWALDFPRLMLRASAIKKRRDGRKPVDHALARTDFVGRIASAAAPLANKVMEKPGSPMRRLVEKVSGISAQRVLPPYAKQRFSTWFKRRPSPLLAKQQAKVALFPTCVVEYQHPQIGHDLVKVYEHNGVACHLPDGLGCCGAPWLHAGDFDMFREQAAKNIPALAQAVRSGYDIVVPQPTCGYVLKKDYAAYMKGTEHHADAQLIGAHTFDTSEYLWKLHKGTDTELAKEFVGNVPVSATYHAACHLQAQNVGLKSRDLMKLTGTKITVVAKCSGIDGTWGYRADNYELARKVAKPLGEAVRRAASEVVVGDCHLANGAIGEETGATAMHPLQYMARAYGLPEER
jgi:glycerol-3-phosphate dehydrogenase subunit C